MTYYNVLGQLILISVFILGANISLMAKSPNEAFFKFSRSNGKIIVRAEVSPNKKNYKLTEKIINNRVNLIGKKENRLKFIDLKVLEYNPENGKAKYEWSYESTRIIKGKNTLLFNLHDDQINHIQFDASMGNLKFKTTKEIPFFRVAKRKGRMGARMIGRLVVLTLFGVYGFQFLRRKVRKR